MDHTSFPEAAELADELFDSLDGETVLEDFYPAPMPEVFEPTTLGYRIAHSLDAVKEQLYSRGMPILKLQEIPFDHPNSKYMFQPSAEKPFVATPAAIEMYQDQIHACLMQLQELAKRHNGLDYLAVFEDIDKPEALWIIEDDTGGAITALLGSDY